MFSSKKSDSKIILILDIQSYTIRGSLVIMNHVEIPRVIFTHSIEINTKNSSDDSSLIKIALDSINQIMQASLRFIHNRENFANFKNLKRKIYSVHYVLSSPWIVSEAKVLSKRFDKETEVTKKYVSDLVLEECKRLSDDANQSVYTIERKIFDVRLNNYSVSDWEHKSAKALDIYFTVSVAGTKMIQCFIDQCKNVVRSNKVEFHSSLLLQYMGIEEVLEPGQNYCLIYIHGGETDVLMVKQKSCIFFGAYSFGVRNLIEEVGKLTNNGRQVADSLITLYTGGKIDDNEGNKKTIEAIEKSSHKWFSGLKELLDGVELEIKPPTSVIVSAWLHDDCFVKIIKDKIRGVPVFILSIDDLLSRVSFENGSDKRRLTALYSIAIHSLID